MFINGIKILKVLLKKFSSRTKKCILSIKAFFLNYLNNSLFELREICKFTYNSDENQYFSQNFKNSKKFLVGDDHPQSIADILISPCRSFCRSYMHFYQKN
jgi:hypothetical protein